MFNIESTILQTITGNTTTSLSSMQLLYIDPVPQTYFSNHKAISASLIKSHVVSKQVLHGQNGFAPKKHSSLDTSSKTGSAVKLNNFKTKHHQGSKTVVLDQIVEILVTEGPFTEQPILETNKSASLFAVHHGKERSVK